MFRVLIHMRTSTAIGCARPTQARTEVRHSPHEDSYPLSTRQNVQFYQPSLTLSPTRAPAGPLAGGPARLSERTSLRLGPISRAMPLNRRAEETARVFASTGPKTRGAGEPRVAP
eukprot:scaffold1085_cov407-Prasinococcus_capsulatus_cf.AAC.93